MNIEQPGDGAGEELRLQVQGLSKRFGGTHALVDVDVTVRAGQVHALLGENGAGKSTLIKILAGVHQPDEGQIIGPAGPAVPGRPVPEISFVHQDLGLVATMTVSENIALGAGYTMHAGLIDWQALARRAEQALAAMGCTFAASQLVGRLSAAEKSMVAIARALSVDAKVLILDEPTATLQDTDVSRLHEVLKRLTQQGLAVVYVTHRLDEVFRFADRATVLRDGKVQATLAIAETDAARLMHHIVGRNLANRSTSGARRHGAAVLQVDELCSNRVGPCSFTVAAGEVLALVGLRGAGHDVVGRMLFGDIPRRLGRIQIDSRTVSVATPEDAMAVGIGFVSSKRVDESICMGLSLRENLYINPKTAGLTTLGTGVEFKAAARVLQSFDVRPPSPNRIMATLSGGNQQKVVLARWLCAKRRVLVLEEPTIGVDVGAKAEIYGLLDVALADDLAIVLISSDFEEVANLADRAIVFDRGRQGCEIKREDLSISALTALATGAMAETAP